ncbi:MAG: fibronectin type III domain-containing protein [Ignavibacteriales bacterium]|nr:fibronectin type III domain-containing protein [Ignavibacteriales bacterium]
MNDSKGLLNPITAKWTKSLRVEKYKLQVSTNNLFTSFILNDSTLTDTTKLLPNLVNYSQYYWRVKAVNVGGESDWSTVWNFKTLGNPYAPNLIEPQNSSVNHPLNGLTFKWTKALERIETVQKYQLQLSTDSLFATTFINDTTLVDTSRIVGGMSYLTKYFWRVRAQNQTGWGDWSETWKLTTIIEKPTISVLATPLNDSKGLLNPITAKWNKSLRVEKYKLQVSSNNLFTSFILNDSTLTDTSKVLPNLANYSQYYWRVKAINVGGDSDWSMIWNFKTLGNPYASNLLTPLDASLNQPLNGLTFKWTKAKERIETIQKYQFQLSTDSLFVSFIINDSTLTDTSKIVNGMGYLTKYFWRVRAQNQTGWGDWSNIWRFTTIIEKPTVPVLATPMNNSLGLLNPIMAKWNKSLRVEKYKLQVSTNNMFTSFILNDSLVTDTTKILPILANYSQYYWRVKAVNVGGESDWSTVWNFKTLGNPYASNLSAPLDASVNQPLNGLTFKWTKAKERIETIQKYQFQISTDSLFGTLFVNDSTLIDTSRIVNGMGYLTKYFWRVKAQNQTGWGDWSATWKFTTIVEKPTVPVMVIPANNTLGLIDPVTFKWNKSQRVEKYAIQLSRTEAFDQVFFSGETFDTLKIYSSTIAPLLPNTRYYWRVRATNIGGYSDWTTGWTFKMLGNPYASTQLQPANQSVNQPVNGLTFKWTKAQERIETIQKYQFQISTDSLFGTLFINDTTLIDTSRIVNGFGYLTKYFWRVRAQNQTGWGDWSETWKFTTIIEIPTVPVLATPLNDSKGLLNPITAKWNKSQRVEKYKLQVSSNNLFTSFILNDSTLTDTTKLLPNLANYSQYYWRVKAVNVGGESDWSTVWNFKTLGNPIHRIC